MVICFKGNLNQCGSSLQKQEPFPVAAIQRHLAGRMTILAIRDIRGVGRALADSNGIFMGF